MRLVAIKKFKSGSTVFHPGDRINVIDEQLLLRKRLARELSKAETMTILDEYIRYAKSIFDTEEGERHE